MIPAKRKPPIMATLTDRICAAAQARLNDPDAAYDGLAPEARRQARALDEHIASHGTARGFTYEQQQEAIAA